jgi:hypothetical protein
MLRKLILSLVVVCALTTVAAAQVHVNGYFRRDGTYVQPHYRSAPDGNPYNNWSYRPRAGLDSRMILEAGPGYVPPLDPLAPIERGLRLRQQWQQLQPRR